MFIVACFSRETRNTTATSEEAITLAKSSRRDRSVMKGNNAGRHCDGEPEPHRDRLGAEQQNEASRPAARARS